MENHAFASLAQIRILLVPVGSIQKPIFDKCAAEIRAIDQIDVPPDDRAESERARFLPRRNTTAHLYLSFPSHPPPHSHGPLSLFRPSHFPLAVIGIASSEDASAFPEIQSSFDDLLSDMFPPGAMFPLAKNCFVFETGEGASSVNLTDKVPGVVVIPNMLGKQKLYLETLLVDLATHILGEFGVLVQTLESPLGNEYLNSSSMPVLPPRSEMPASLDADAKQDPPSLLSHNSQPEISKSAFTLSSAPVKRNSSAVSALPSAGFRQSTFGAPVLPKKRASGIGAASSHGRLYKVFGDLFMLAGRTDDSMTWYSEAIALFKGPQDAAWHASALEAMATLPVLEAWSAGQGLNTSTSGGKEPWSDISDKLTQAAALYSKAPLSEMEQNYALLTYLYSCCVIRNASLLFAIWSAKGWGPMAFTTMLQPGPHPYLPPTLSHGDNGSLSLDRLSIISGVSRSSIAAALTPLHGPWLLHLGARERVDILETLAGLYSCLGYKRKEAYILREVLGCVMDLLVCGREEDGASRITGLPTHTPGTADSTRGDMGIRHSESSVGNESILRLLKYVCKVLRIEVDAVKLLHGGLDPAAQPAQAETLEAASLAYDNDIAEELQEQHGWSELQVGVVREAVAVAEALPDFMVVAQFALSALRTQQAILSAGDQYHLYSTAARAVATARRRGDMQTLTYWSGRPIISITVAAIAFQRMTVEKPLSALSTKLPNVNAIIPGSTDPFLYNPRKAQANQGKTLVVQNEELEFIVMMQNPYVFDLELESLSLSTSGVQFETRPIRLAVPAASFQPVLLSGKALETGNLTVRGCIVQAPGGTPREFILPLATEEEELRLSRKRSALACETDRYKYSGLSGITWSSSPKRSSAQLQNTTFKFLECTVVPEQPLLRIRRTSVTHGAVMLYEGETSNIRLTLENVSSLPIDFLRLAFEDSTMGPAQQALADGQLSVFDTYETEYDLLHQPLFVWNGNTSVDMAPAQKLPINVQCFGKAGCTTGTIHISYGYVQRPTEEGKPPPSVFHTRQLSYPIMITVYQMLECFGMDVLAISTHGSSDHSVIADRKSDLRVEEEGWCLFSVEVKNTYGVPFEVTFERVQEGTGKATATTVISPGSTSKIVIPIKKMLLPTSRISKPIPTLSDRQFVVDKFGLSAEEEQTQRELFWYREELFKCVNATWREAGGTRHGGLSLRRQRMSLRMLDILRTEKARVSLSLLSCSNEGETLIPYGQGVYHPLPHEFVYLRIKVTCFAPDPGVFVVDLDLSPAQHVLYEGVLSSIPIGRLRQGESRELDVLLCFLCYGRFDITAQVRTILNDRAGSDRISSSTLLAVIRQ
ncbi:hypothetical protein HGRIS_013034 [Hohenbuehelia grisea]|uniref:Transport protein particle subunit trs120 n=1 Tax=Hohenbuehelia grisea TaxID=104357 RepID=A0ABR3IUB3_9AGAR